MRIFLRRASDSQRSLGFPLKLQAQVEIPNLKHTSKMCLQTFSNLLLSGHLHNITQTEVILEFTLCSFIRHVFMAAVLSSMPGHTPTHPYSLAEKPPPLRGFPDVLWQRQSPQHHPDAHYSSCGTVISLCLSSPPNH